jgi:hypothetical protein
MRDMLARRLSGHENSILSGQALSTAPQEGLSEPVSLRDQIELA